MRWIQVTLLMLIVSNHAIPQSNPPAVLPAPTYYLAAAVRECSSSSAEVVGVTNLPAGAVVSVDVAAMVGNGWEEKSKPTHVAVGSDGRFRVVVEKLEGSRFLTNDIARVYFGPAYANQPANVLKVIGRKGEKLGDYDNPQFGKVSGENYYLQTIARVDSCGP